MLEKTEFLLLEKKEGKCYHKIIFKDKGDFFFLDSQHPAYENPRVHTEHSTHGMGDARTTEALPMSDSRSCGFHAREMQLGFWNPNREPAHTSASVLMTRNGEDSGV